MSCARNCLGKTRERCMVGCCCGGGGSARTTNTAVNIYLALGLNAGGEFCNENICRRASVRASTRCKPFYSHYLQSILPRFVHPWVLRGITIYLSKRGTRKNRHKRVQKLELTSTAGPTTKWAHFFALQISLICIPIFCVSQLWKTFLRADI